MMMMRDVLPQLLVGVWMAVFTLEDEKIVSDKQIVSCEHVKNKFFDEQTVWYLAVWKVDFSKTICPWRRKYTSGPGCSKAG